MDLKTLRERLSNVDDQIIDLVAERQRLVREIGELKQQVGRATRDYDREKVVMTRAADKARERSLNPRLAEDLMRHLIRSSLTSQEQAKVASSGQGDGRRALVIGGGGRMGGWFVHFLASQGFVVEIADPTVTPGEIVNVGDWEQAKLDHDVIVVAAPLRTSGEILEKMVKRDIPGLIFDIGSLKSPLRNALRRLADSGHKITSIHPMFGPDTDLLSDRHVIFVDVGCEAATREAMELFDATMAQRVDMNLDDHDRSVAFVLGLSHAINIAFAGVLAASGESAPDLERISSTTFDDQLDISRRVLDENPNLYFEIQSLNDFGLQPLKRLAEVVSAISDSVAAGDEQSFVAMMRTGQNYFENLPDPAAERSGNQE